MDYKLVLTPDLVIADISLGDDDGIQLIEAIRQLNADLPILDLCSGLGYPPKKNQGLSDRLDCRVSIKCLLS